MVLKCSDYVCLSPIVIPNPNFGRKDKLAYLVDTKSRNIKVPCGHCTECVFMRQSSIVQRCLVEELDNHLFFCTLTYNNESLPYLSCSNGYDIRYADMRDFVLMMKRLRKHDEFDRSVRYFVVSELGSKRGRPHFHAILFVPKRPDDGFPQILQLEEWLFRNVLFEWRRNYGSTRSPIYKPLCTYQRRWIRGELKSNYDLHYLNPRSSKNGSSDVVFYVSKYMLKPSDREERLQQALKLNLDADEYEAVWKVVKSRFHASTGFGLSSDLQREYIRDCIEKSRILDKNPKFYSSDGFSYPLSRYYYRKGVINVDDVSLFLSKRENPDDPIYIDDRASDVKVRKIDKLSLLVDQVEKNDLSFDFDSICI